MKFWLHISPEEQLKRFESRAKDPIKTWKLTDEDWRNRERRDDYTAAVEEMLDRTDAPTAPWTLIEAESKSFARMKVMWMTIWAIEEGLRARGHEPPPPL